MSDARARTAWERAQKFSCLKNIGHYGEVGYTIIDDVLSLPERMPAIYRRLTT